LRNEGGGTREAVKVTIASQRILYLPDRRQTATRIGFWSRYIDWPPAPALDAAREATFGTNRVTTAATRTTEDDRRHQWRVIERKRADFVEAELNRVEAEDVFLRGEERGHGLSAISSVPTSSQK
jgi:hypothetical protein